MAMAVVLSSLSVGVLPSKTLTLPKTLTLSRSRTNLLFSQFPKSFSSSVSPLSSRVEFYHAQVFPSSSPFSLSSPLCHIEPFILSEWEPILKGWICGAVSVYCLSRTVPCVGRLPCFLRETGSDRAIREGLILAALAATRCVAAYLQQGFLWEASFRSAYRVRAHVFDRVLERDLGFFEGNTGVPAGDVAFRITSEASDVADTVYALLNTIVPTTLQLIAMSAQMVMVIPCMSLLIGYLGERLREISNEAHSTVAKLSAYLNEVLPSMLTVKANNGESKESLRFQRLALDDLVKNLRKKKMKALIPQTVHGMYIGGLLVLCAMSLIVSRNSFDASNCLSFLMALALLVEPIQDVGKAYNELKQGEPAIERLFDLTKFVSKVCDKPQAVDLYSVSGDIKFCNVTFKYLENMPPVLDGLNLHIKPGERVAFVGPSGGGKTTLVKLLLRLYDPCGCIFLDDHDIRDIRLRSLRKHIVLVSQDAMLFSGTFSENISYKDDTGKVNMVQIENAARIANADEFIKTFPEGYDTDIGQRGSLLSGGQKQRLAIARALYEESSILILDEATSSLDSRSELFVRQGLNHLMANRTVLIIAHRLETVQLADRVFVLDGGKLEEVPKSALFAQDGQLASLELSKLII
ncbi:ABC transporter B family member 29, chloroplastic isoform X2 [Typha angustifolia]|uniref:ABC transporter B family member 29, chloroplastic isoform X2 n=2 Tax=Typha angustifolia TaxID=59011 RepID=UPI003C2C9AE2